MTPEEKQKEIERLEGEIGAFTNLLQQGDYRARKLIHELGGIIKTQFPNVSTPVYDSYLAKEEQAQTFRNEINRLQDEIERIKHL